jgi:RPA family protein
MPEQESQARQVAYKVPIVSLLKNEFIQQEGWNPNYIKINENQVSRINLIATVIDKQATESLITLTLDDSTSTIQARAFNEDVKKATDINIGDPILLIGRPRKYNEQIFVTIEVIKKVDPLWTKVRKLELQKNFNLNPVEETTVIQETPTPPVETAGSSLNESGDKILNLIKDLDDGDGADLNQVILKSGLTESQAQPVIEELIKLGEVYEPKPSKIKILG